MTFLPVVERELRVASRRSQTYWIRFWAVALTLFVCGWVWWMFTRHNTPTARAQSLFYTIAILAFAYSLLAGVWVTADCLSQEKRDGTLGLLFLTDLKGYDVILGKLTATSMESIYRLMAVFPVLAIPLLMGGVTAAEFWRMVLVLLNTLLFSLAAGMFVSALSEQPLRSALGTFGLIMLVAAGPPLLERIVIEITMKTPRNFSLPSPAYAWSLTFDAAFRANIREFWISVGVTHALTWLLLLVSSVLLPHSWQDKPAGHAGRKWKQDLHRWRYGVAQVRARFRTRLLEVNPFYWLASRDRAKPYSVLLMLGLGTLLWLALFAKVPHGHAQ